MLRREPQINAGGVLYRTAAAGRSPLVFIQPRAEHDPTAEHRGPAVNRAVTQTGVAADTTGPSISGIASSPGTDTSTVTWPKNEPADSQVQYGTTTSYGLTTTLDGSLTLTHTQSLTGLTPSTTYHFRVRSRDAAGNLSTSIDQTFTTAAAPDTAAPVISNVLVSASTNSRVTFSWKTNEKADSQTDYGLTAVYDKTTPIDVVRVTNHSVVATGFVPNAKYHFRVKSRDAAGNLGVSTDFIFTMPVKVNKRMP